MCNNDLSRREFQLPDLDSTSSVLLRIRLIVFVPFLSATTQSIGIWNHTNRAKNYSVKSSTRCLIDLEHRPPCILGFLRSHSSI